MSPIAAEMQVVQLYEVVRTAHLERAAATVPRPVILYRRARYDFDEAVARTVDLRRRSLLASIAFALGRDIDVIEVNEPLSGDSSLPAVAFAGAARLRALVRRRPRPLVVTYAIENLEPETLLRNLPLKARWRHRLRHLTTPLLWRSLDRIAYGTSDAQRVYARAFARSRGRPASALIEALPSPAADADGSREQIILFLGDLSERKGFPDVVSAWPHVRDRLPDARLLVLGRGAGSATASSLAQGEPRVRTVIEPSRAAILGHLRSAKVLVLPSRRRPLWREQVGLPIVEGLANGCLVVTSSETGIADWLSAHGHWVLPEEDLPAGLGDALLAALTSSRTPGDVQADLPAADGRLRAQEWMYGGGEVILPR
ncbi:glycosyltransferase family 4 protein [Microbacterium terricola]|uniref:Uncharacterized protein n=1 Tax=Microbacterium terricola TaxID=344163 RepID=A0ABM8DV93_9MICO|nr:glycosyltransferase family 4 protein [Microbacterium terricola]UYK39732.1 glycosyltransferase family 4 protein [Microbacterium terricola]BDV29519.1 hypothetical protein Microterr_01790 [Microbacterium terricola]